MLESRIHVYPKGLRGTKEKRNDTRSGKSKPVTGKEHQDICGE